MFPSEETPSESLLVGCCNVQAAVSPDFGEIRWLDYLFARSDLERHERWRTLEVLHSVQYVCIVVNCISHTLLSLLSYKGIRFQNRV